MKAVAEFRERMLLPLISGAVEDQGKYLKYLTYLAGFATLARTDQRSSPCLPFTTRAIPMRVRI